MRAVPATHIGAHCRAALALASIASSAALVAWPSTSGASARAHDVAASAGATVHCTSDLPEFGPLSVTQSMPAGSSGFLQLGEPTSSSTNKFIGTCTLSGTIPPGWTVNEAPSTTLSASPGSGNAGSFVWNSVEDDASITDPGSFTNSGTFVDDAVGFVQDLVIGRLINTGTVVSNAPGFGAEGTTDSPPCTMCTFVDAGSVHVAAKAVFSSGSIFRLAPGGKVSVAHGGAFDIANESTFDVDGGSATGKVLTGQFLGQGPATVEFAHNLAASSRGTIDVASNADLHGVIAKHWVIENTGGSITASVSGNDGSFVMEPGLDDAALSDSTTFTNSGTFVDNATGFTQSIEMPSFVNTGTLVDNAPSFTVSAPSGVMPSFLDDGSVIVGPKGGFSASGVFHLVGRLANHGGFSIDGTTFDVEGGAVSGNAISALYHLGATPDTVRFVAAPPSSSGTIDIGIPTTLDGVVPAHWVLAAVSGPGTSITADKSGNDGTIDWSGNGGFTASGTFANHGTLSLAHSSDMQAKVQTLLNAAHGKVVVAGGAELAVTGNLSNAGTLDVTADRVTVSDAYSQAPTGVVAIQVTGNGTSGELEVGGAAALAGGLSIVKAPGYSAHAGDSQQLLTAHSTTGRFRTVVGTSYGNGLSAVVGYGASGVTLTVHKG